jgi:hypothetical protein
VLSLELAGTRDAGADVVAAAGIVASQLATLLEPLPKAETEPVEPTEPAQPPAVRAEA